jgi:hypothetical protein
MKNPHGLMLLSLLAAPPATAQQSGLQDPLLDRLAGQWVMTGTIAGAEITHDVDAEWVLGHNYLRIKDVSRERTAAGAPEYEAIVFIGWDATRKQYDCLWLDVTGGGGLTGEGIGHGRRVGDEIPFVFRLPDGSVIHNTFANRGASDSWEWHIDNESDGKRTPFARVTLHRR